MLSLEHSLFLCRFLAALTNNAKKISATLDEKTYISALTNTMQQFVFDDCLKYGCLIELKNGLDLVFEQTPLPNVVLSLLYANDFSKLRGVDSSSIAMNLI